MGRDPLAAIGLTGEELDDELALFVLQLDDPRFERRVRGARDERETIERVKNEDDWEEAVSKWTSK